LRTLITSNVHLVFAGCSRSGVSEIVVQMWGWRNGVPYQHGGKLEHNEDKTTAVDNESATWGFE
jgi:hypothetical protein